MMVLVTCKGLLHSPSSATDALVNKDTHCLVTAFLTIDNPTNLRLPSQKCCTTARMSDGSERRKRKWDAPAPVTATTTPAVASFAFASASVPAAAPGQPTVNPDAFSRAAAAAAAIASKLATVSFMSCTPTRCRRLQHNQLTLLSLNLQKSSAQAAAKASAEIRVDIVKEVIINDSAASARHHLTKRTTQDEIQARTHTVIVTKGRYYAPGAPQDDKEKPLHLRITPGAHAGQVSTARIARIPFRLAAVAIIILYVSKILSRRLDMLEPCDQPRSSCGNTMAALHHRLLHQACKHTPRAKSANETPLHFHAHAD
jgi:hypothetical protein